MFFLFLFIILLFLNGFFKKGINSYCVLIYGIGLLLIPVHVFLLFDGSGSFFAGSDASNYYQEAKSVYNNWEIIKVMDVRYVGYNIYQILMAFPFLNNELLSSLLIKLNSWTIVNLLFFKLLTSLRIHAGIDLFKNRLFAVINMLMVLFLCMYNFRDIVILQILILISVFYFSGGKKSRLYLLLCLLVLFYFRYFYVLIIVVAFIFSRLIGGKLKLKYLAVEALSILVFLSIIGLAEYALLLLNFESLLGAVSTLQSGSENVFVALLKGVFAGNPLLFLYDYFDGFQRAFFITNVSAFLVALIYFGSYLMFGFLLLDIGYIFMLRWRGLTNEGRAEIVNENRLVVFFRALVYFILGVAFLYSSSMEGLQERIRIPLIFLSFIFVCYNRSRFPKLARFDNLVLTFFSIVSILVFFLSI